MPNPLQTAYRVVVAGLLISGCVSQSVQPDRHADSIRAQAGKQGGIIEIQPLQDPAIAELYRQAQSYESQGKHRWAIQRVRQALKLAPGHPELLQYLAELLLNQGHAELALNYARDSWERGPRVGPLCSRNWLTMASAYRMQGKTQQAQQADQQAKHCAVQAGKRL